MKKLLLVCGLFLSACETPIHNGVQTVVYEMDPGTQSYQEVFKKYWRSETVYSNYETLYMINVAAFYPEFTQALNKANIERFHGLKLLKGLSNSTFFVSIYSPHDELNNLANTHIWEFVLKIGMLEHTAATVTKIRDKDTWGPFFPFSNRWTSDYLVSFDLKDAQTLSSDTPLSLSLTNSKAKTVMSWQKQ